MSQHYGRIEKSRRLQRLLAYLRMRGKWGATSMNLSSELHRCSIATDISELRRNGYQVNCEYLRTTSNGSRVHLYTLEEG